MARIAFFTENLPPDADFIARFSYDLMLSLADQQHDIRVFSTYRHGRELPPAHPRIEVLRPFRNWSWLELPQVAPLLMQFRPEIIHIVQPHAQALSGWTNAMNALPGFKFMLGDPLLVSSFYNLRPAEIKAYQLLLRLSDVITVANEMQKNVLEIKMPTLKHQLLAVLPVTASIQEGGAADELTVDTQFADNQADFLNAHDKYVLIPGSLDKHENPEFLFAFLSQILSIDPRVGVIFGGGWGRIPPRLRKRYLASLADLQLDSQVLIAGELLPEQERGLISGATFVFIATLHTEDLYYTYLVRQALKQRALILMSTSQAAQDTLPLEHERHAVISPLAITDLSRAWRQALTNAVLRQEISAQLSEFSRLEVIDHPGNIMSRLYVQGLSQKILK